MFYVRSWRISLLFHYYLDLLMHNNKTRQYKSCLHFPSDIEQGTQGSLYKVHQYNRSISIVFLRDANYLRNNSRTKWPCISVCCDIYVIYTAEILPYFFYWFSVPYIPVLINYFLWVKILLNLTIYLFRWRKEGGESFLSMHHLNRHTQGKGRRSFAPLPFRTFC